MFFEKLENNKIPRELLDTNIYSDYNQIKNIVNLFDKNIYRETIIEILENKSTNDLLKQNFFLEGHQRDRDYLISLLYYFGYLTIKSDIENINYITFIIPNRIIEKVFNGYFVTILNDNNIYIDPQLKLNIDNIWYKEI